LLLPNCEDWGFWLCNSVDDVMSCLFYCDDGGVSFNPPIPSWTSDESDKSYVASPVSLLRILKFGSDDRFCNFSLDIWSDRDINYDLK
jgi:hypothetical protein